MDFTFKKKSDLSTILTVDLNAEAGQWDDEEFPLRYTVHRTLDGVQVELRDNPPVMVKGDRQVVLSALVITPTERNTLLDIRDGGQGLPVLLSNAFIAGNGIEGLLVVVDTLPNPGANTFNLVRAVFQPTV